MMRKSKYLRYFVAGITNCVLLCGMMSGCGIRDSALVIPIEDAETTVDAGEVEIAGESYDEIICVYVCGAVVNPGVVELPEGSRADDALQAAGGFAEDAQRDYVNLAARLTDGEMLYFPTIAEVDVLEASQEAQQKGLVNINTADVSQLMTLPGIGETRAQDIIAYREVHGEFQNKEDLMKVSGIKENMYEKLCDKIIVR